jgi:vancomycin resistance protein VanJ
MTMRVAARAARLLVVAVLAGAVAVSVAYHWSHLQTWWVELTRYAPYPVHLLPALAAVLASLGLGRGWRLAALASLGLVATVVMGFEFGQADPGSGKFRLMTYNVKAYLARDRPDGFALIAREISIHDPDVVVMQDADAAKSPADGFLPALRGVLDGRKVYAFEQYVVASRLPLKDCRPGSIPFRDEPHAYVHCVLTVDGSEIDLVTVHFVSPRDGLNAARRERLDGLAEWKRNFIDRLAQARKLAADLAANGAARRRPLIVAGDLNSLETSPVIRALLDVGLRDAFSSAGTGYGFTQGHALRLGFSFLRIDHILVSPTLGVSDCFVGGREASEHRPVIADLLVHRQ